MARTIKIEMTLEQGVETLRGLKLRRTELERHNPRMDVPIIRELENLEITLAVELSGVPH